MSLHFLEGIEVTPEHRGTAALLVQSSNVDEIARLVALAEHNGNGMTDPAAGEDLGECRNCHGLNVERVASMTRALTCTDCDARWCP